MTTTLEELAGARTAAKAAHRTLRLQLNAAHVHVWSVRDGAKEAFEEALTAYLAEPTDESIEAVVVARGRLDAFESLQTAVTSRRDQAADAGTGI